MKANEAAALKEFNDEKNKQFRDRNLFVFCFGVADGNFTAYQSPLLLGSNVRELKLENDPIGQRAYDAVHDAPEGSVVTIEYNLPKPATKKPASKESLRGAHRQSGLRRQLFQIVFRSTHPTIC